LHKKIQVDKGVNEKRIMPHLPRTSRTRTSRFKGYP
jgi:hypothetical protein